MKHLEAWQATGACGRQRQHISSLMLSAPAPRAPLLLSVVRRYDPAPCPCCRSQCQALTAPQAQPPSTPQRGPGSPAAQSAGRMAAHPPRRPARGGTKTGGQGHRASQDAMEGGDRNRGRWIHVPRLEAASFAQVPRALLGPGLGRTLWPSSARGTWAKAWPPVYLSQRGGMAVSG
jgi:hypothetical protein